MFKTTNQNPMCVNRVSRFTHLYPLGANQFLSGGIPHSQALYPTNLSGLQPSPHVVRAKNLVATGQEKTRRRLSFWAFQTAVNSTVWWIGDKKKRSTGGNIPQHICKTAMFMDVFYPKHGNERFWHIPMFEMYSFVNCESVVFLLVLFPVLPAEFPPTVGSKMQLLHLATGWGPPVMFVGL